MALVLNQLKRKTDPRLLVGINTADDAGVFLLQENLALVQTVDLLTPVVDDPYTFGRIAATNSLSDVYAMAGTPVTALNVVGFPTHGDEAWLAGILQGGEDAVSDAGAVVCGGHTFNEEEIKYGLAVTGTVDPKQMITNAGARPGDVLLLTKPLGSGLFAQALMSRPEVDPELYKAATTSMSTLNEAASRAMIPCGVHAATDITGFGILGHGQELAEASGVCLRFSLDSFPFLPGVRELSDSGLVDAGVVMNESSFRQHVDWDDGLTKSDRTLLWGSETSGGLLVSLPEAGVKQFQEMAGEKGVQAKVVGEVLDDRPGRIQVRR